MQTKPNSFFSRQEIILLYDAEIYPLKRSATEKLFTLFGNMIPALKDTAIHKEFPFPEGTDITTGKISKGENHKDYPYVVLDFPKKFDKETIFSIRNMFWYGHYFSSSLILAGNDMHSFLPSLIEHIKTLYGKDIYFSVFEDPWSHEVEEPYNVLIDTLSPKQILQHATANSFVKLTYRYSENEPEAIISTAVKYYEILLKSLL